MPEPWETPVGQACIEKWIAVATAKLNSHVGSEEFNLRKPWGYNQYGILIGRGISSPGMPDLFPEYGYNKYHFMWGTYPPDDFPDTRDFAAAGVPHFHGFVLSCEG